MAERPVEPHLQLLGAHLHAFWLLVGWELKNLGKSGFPERESRLNRDSVLDLRR